MLNRKALTIWVGIFMLQLVLFGFVFPWLGDAKPDRITVHSIASIIGILIAVASSIEDKEDKNKGEDNAR